ncbi:uncharacterized protein LOC114525750 [Dendronephthya gigantea]|uniref:uncharacterized protein LOC114525750 n=1 Tax=Dendronephthya gigantea TaxID=151771 RepID=UPI00106D013F|nr:uncharacterized protein LOC114525750 [Dendronephthya gigantea]
MSNRRQQQPPPKSTDFVAHVYQEDYREIQKLVKQYPEIETGGDLFGLWQDESTVVIQLFIGPGKNCNRTTTSFHQDIDYLKKVGSVITTEDGLCNVGEWHSHHQIGMPGPSRNDCRTVFSNMPQLGLERFVLFIASIESKVAGRKSHKRSLEVELDEIKLRPFLFLGSKESVVEGKIEIIHGKNPHIESSRARSEIEKGAALPPVDYLRRKKADKKEQEKEEQQAPQFSRETKPNKNKEKAGGGKESSATSYDNFHGRVSNDENRSPNRSQAASQEGSNYGKTGSRQGVQGDRDRTQRNTQHETRTELHTSQGQVSTPIDALTGKGFF